MSLSDGKISFTIFLVDPESQSEKKIRVKLLSKTKTAKPRYTRELLKRTKRRWRLQPFSIMESYIGPFPCLVQQIQSDTQVNYTIRYSLSGPGVNEEPAGLFYIQAETGNIYYTRRVDREEYGWYNLTAYAKTVDGYSPELPLDINVKVEDANDNAPIFVEEEFCIEVPEQTKAGQIIGRVLATDRDEPGSLHTTLRYSIISQFPTSPVMFALNAENGVITTTSNKLDREVANSYVLIIGVRDMPGQRSFLSSTGTVSITVTDINDCPPYFIYKSYQVEVKENESGMVILRIPIKDDDLINSPNWRAKYSITQGNEKGYFNISTDPNTNEGLLMVVKGLNYEETPRIQLQVGVANEVPLITPSGTKSSGLSTIPVTVLVLNVDEGPEFAPNIKEIYVKEGQPAGTPIYKCQAIDPEMRNSVGIRYSKFSDPYNWVNVDENTCQITSSRVLVYEKETAPRHQNNVTVIAVDQSGKTGSGTIIINLEPIDNFPKILQYDKTICQSGRTYSILTAEDRSAIKTTSPLIFRLDSSQTPSLENTFELVKINATAVRVQPKMDLPYGEYSVPIYISNSRGEGSTQIVKIEKCFCTDLLDCDSTIGRMSSGIAALGGWAILVMVLSAVLFALLLFGLCACLCGAAALKSKKGFPDDSAQQNLIVTNSEAPGADVMNSNFRVPVHMTKANVTGDAPPMSGKFQGAQNGGQFVQRKTDVLYSENAKGGFPSDGTRSGHHLVDTNRFTYTDWHTFMNSHLGEKLYMCGQNEEHQHGEDYVLSYNFEGKGSAAGSIGCCSDFREEDKLDFLNNLEPKFRTLAEVCAKK
ncbi:hypothetical protein GDO86_011053 [Hymenochirus boettgeri]|nr:hypothetical protein GDO86_011053 [Hymenochirus boettgeri]